MAVQRVGCNPNTIDELGTVRYVNARSGKPLVEFDNNINGHDGDALTYLGKNGHCWYCELDEITHVEQINRVIYNDPATIILWNDGSKTVAKCMDGDTYDSEKGFLVAYLKKFVDSDTLREEMSKWVEDDNKPLTNGELRKLDGQNVWCSSICDGVEKFDDSWCGWHIVNSKENRLDGVSRGYYDITDNGDRYGFKAYRKPPKGVK